MSDYARTTIQHTPLSPYIRHLRLDFQQLHYSDSLSQAHHVTASHPSPGDKPPERGRAVRKNTGTKQNGRVIYICTWAYSQRSLHSHPSAPKATCTPSIQPNLCLPHTRSPLTSAINTVFTIRSSSMLSTSPIISLLSDPLYSSTHFLFQLFYAPLHS